jgi:predicted transcriptional regulator
MLLILPCEVAVKSVIPAVKALIAQELVTEHGLKQDQVAEILGISQSAVSKYSRKIRGHAVRIDDMEEIQPLVGNMIDLLMNGTYQRSEFLQLFCQACIAVRKTSVMCDFCRKSSPNLKIEDCSYCTNITQKKK